MRESVKLRRPVSGQLSQSPLSFDLRLYRPQSIAAFVAELRARGVDVSAALEGTDIVQSQLEPYATKIVYRRLDRVLRNARRLSRDPPLALRAGLRMHVNAEFDGGASTSTRLTFGRPNRIAS